MICFRFDTKIGPVQKLILLSWAFFIVSGFAVLFAEVPMPGDIEKNDEISLKPVKSDSYLYNWYSRVSEKSIHRCPFKTSCSNYALKAFQEKGLIPGILNTVDRYYFRENQAARYYYKKTRSNGRLLLDDDFFLDGKL